MPEVIFGRKNSPALTLTQSSNLLDVRTFEKEENNANNLGLANADLIMTIPRPAANIYAMSSQTEDSHIEEQKAKLRANPKVRYAETVFVDKHSGDPYFCTGNIFIKFFPDVPTNNCQVILRQLKFTIVAALDYSTNAYFVTQPSGTGAEIFEMATSLLSRNEVEFCHPELIRPGSGRAIFNQQWHLKTTPINGNLVQASANVESAHQITQGQGVTIAIIDDGVDIDHVEFAGLGKIVAPRDFVNGGTDPRPSDFLTFAHGTACAGVACANGSNGASGVAPKARLMPIKINTAAIGSMEESNAFMWAAKNGADIISCSWGPIGENWRNPRSPAPLQPIPAHTREAINYAATKGRNGKGCVVLFAAGNGNESVDEDKYASDSNVLAIAACNDRGKRCVYSDFGQALWCAFPSSDIGHIPFNHPTPLTPGIWTTDRTGIKGYNVGNPLTGDSAGNYYNQFGMTSSACAGVAGIAALILSVNPQLRQEDVREIIRQSCDKIDPQGGQYNANGHSQYYGYGRPNAFKAVQLANLPLM